MLSHQLEEAEQYARADYLVIIDPQNGFDLEGALLGCRAGQYAEVTYQIVQAQAQALAASKHPPTPAGIEEELSTLDFAEKLAVLSLSIFAKKDGDTGRTASLARSRLARIAYRKWVRTLHVYVLSCATRHTMRPSTPHDSLRPCLALTLLCTHALPSRFSVPMPCPHAPLCPCPALTLLCVHALPSCFSVPMPCQVLLADQAAACPEDEALRRNVIATEVGCRRMLCLTRSVSF